MMSEKRKLDHIELSLQDKNQAFSSHSSRPSTATPTPGTATATSEPNANTATHAPGTGTHEPSSNTPGTGLEQLQLRHEALPDLNFNEIELEHDFLGLKAQKPLLISCMTGGPKKADHINYQLAELAEARGWLMGLGSQRSVLEAGAAHPAAPIRLPHPLRKNFKRLKLLGNIGIPQLIHYGPDALLALMQPLELSALVVHTNPLQECLQPEGTPYFCGSRWALEQLCRRSTTPVVLKETGCGFSPETLQSLVGIGLAAVDISGYGGTHWGRIEGERTNAPIQQAAAQTFAHWGVPTARTLQAASQLNLDYEVWASGGLRSGLDAAKCFALGAQCAGFAQPLLKALLQKGEKGLELRMQQIEFELRLALFCTGSQKVVDLKGKVFYP